ncbi:MAG: hypothetical protein WC889_02895 [Myxococcota bacterium]|jgi:hypothetical protein
MSADQFIARACEATGLSPAQITGLRKLRTHVRARWAILHALEQAQVSHRRAARDLRIDRTTAIHGIRKAAELRASDPDFAALCAAVEGR